MSKSGFVAVLGRPNAGKSSLINVIVGEKVSIVSPKPQTTRTRANGILTGQDYQMILVDTPGAFNPKTELDNRMKNDIKSASLSADAIVWVLDCQKGFSVADEKFLIKLLKNPAPLYIVVNKIDLSGYENVYKILDKLNSYLNAQNNLKDIVAVSCKTRQNIDVLKEMLIKELPQGEFLYPEDEYTDKSERFLAGEIIREKALLFLQQEIPHGVGIIIQRMQDEKDIVNIDADIVIEKPSHKKIVIGEGGYKLKEIATSSRIAIEKMLDKKVFLKLFVKVRENWRNKPNILEDLGYEKGH